VKKAARIKICLLAALTFLTPQLINAQFSEQLQSDVTVRDLLEGYQRNPRADTYYLMALAEARKNNIAEAEKAIKTGLSIDPRNTRLMNLQGAIRARQGRLAEARRYFLNVLQLNPDDKFAETSLRSIESRMQPNRNRVNVINKPGPLQKFSQPDSPIQISPQPKVEKKILDAVYFKQVRTKQQCYYSMSSIQLAQQRFLDTNPKYPAFSLTNLVEQGLLTAIPLCPESGTYSYSDSEVVCSVHGKQTQVGSEVTNVFSDFNRGMKAKLSRRYLDALKDFEQVVILYPRWAEAHFQLADTLFRLGETDPAIVSLRTCLKYEPQNLDAQLLLANLYFKKGQKNAALDLLDKVATKQKGTVYGLSARSIAKSIRSGRNYYQIFPPN
jgi:Flp pilus assembly protein TadD